MATNLRRSPLAVLLGISSCLAPVATPASANEASQLIVVPSESITSPRRISPQVTLIEPTLEDIYPADLSNNIALSGPVTEEVFPEALPLEEVALDGGIADGGAVIVSTDLVALPVEESTLVDEPFGYNTVHGRTTWLPGDDDRFGIVSLEEIAMLQPGAPIGLVAGWGFHFLDGPVRTEMPPRLFDFTVGYQRREWIRPNIGWDFVFRVGAFSDFEGSARDGVRFPSHLVTFWRLTPSLTGLVGIDYLD